jgi:mannose-6-phosphate isomerase-like protein (cupin superfamily)
VELDVGHPVLLPPGGGEIIGDSPERRVEILSDHETLNATWSRFGPGREGADLHVHRQHTDFFYVLEGELTVRLGLEDETVAVQAGTLVRVPPLVVHGFRNASDGELRYLNFHAPGQRFADYLRSIRDRGSFSYDQFDPPADGVRPSSEAAIGEELFVADRPGLSVTLLTDIEAVGIAVATSEPGSPSPPPHFHPNHVESFYVLEGEMTFTADGRELRAETGSWVQIPPGVAHTFAFTGDEPATFLNLHSPSCGFGDFVRGLHEAKTADDLVAVRAAFDMEPAA